MLYLNFSLESGYRNSGLTLGKSGKVVLAVRSTHGLEVPLTDNLGTLLVERNYIEFIIDQANTKLLENENRVKSFESRCDNILFKISAVTKDKYVGSLGTLKSQGEAPQVHNQETD